MEAYFRPVKLQILTVNSPLVTSQLTTTLFNSAELMGVWRSTALRIGTVSIAASLKEHIPNHNQKQRSLQDESGLSSPAFPQFAFCEDGVPSSKCAQDAGLSHRGVAIVLVGTIGRSARHLWANLRYRQRLNRRRCYQCQSHNNQSGNQAQSHGQDRR